MLSVLKSTIGRGVLWFFSGSAARLYLHLKLMNHLKSRGHNKLAVIVSNRLQIKFCVFISPKAKISETVKFPHPTGIVIGDGVSIGKFVTIYQNVTLGGARIGDARKNQYPEIGDGTVIFAGAVVLGQVTIGKNCIIGANSVVLQDIPDNSTAVGAPAQIVCVRSSQHISGGVVV